MTAMTPESVEPAGEERLARLFHDTYERLAPSFGYETRTETRRFDPATPNGRLMIAVCAEIRAALRTEYAADCGETLRRQQAETALASCVESLASMEAECDGLRKKIENSYIKNCFIIPKEGDGVLFGAESYVVRLDGYRIAPRTGGCR